ncbi:MAG: YIP1 family protein [Rhodobiaceae bacterium]|nr:YIP1 family protein [Rhodobiaceae bacterium]
MSDPSQANPKNAEKIAARISIVFQIIFDLLLFRKPRYDPRKHAEDIVSVGLVITWVVGIGRYWDNPRAELWQYFGLGSVAYVFILSALIWSMVARLAPKNWSYVNVLGFVCVTSLPGILYAVPVELVLPPAAAGTANMLFLLVVATWRVALLYQFLMRAAGLSVPKVIVATFLPITLIVTTLSILNLEHVVFDIMAGIAAEDKSTNDAAYSVLLVVTTGSIFAFPFLLIAYLVQLASVLRTNKEKVVTANPDSNDGNM